MDVFKVYTLGHARNFISYWRKNYDLVQYKYMIKLNVNMKSFSEKICHDVEEFILLALRLHPKIEWDGGLCWWPGVVSSWHEWASCRSGRPVTESAFRAYLLGSGVPESAFRKPGAHTWVDLEHISFLYRTRRYKDGSSALVLSPHVRGQSFHACSHLFCEVEGDPGEIARMILELDACIPAARKIAAEALVKGYQERTMRAIKYQAASAWIQDYFHGELPGSYIGFEIADSTPGAMDIIRLTFHDEGTPSWDKRFFNIPYDSRDFLERKEVAAFAADLSLRIGSLEMFRDDDGTDIPVICYKSDESLLNEEDDDDDI